MSITEGHIERHHFFRMRYTELNEIYAFMSLRSFSLALITIFIPIYLYKIGFSLTEIFLYYGMMYFFEFLTEYPTVIILKKLGPKHTISISTPFLIFHLAQLLSLNVFPWPMWSVALTGGICLGLFWQSYHYDFSRAKHRASTSKEVGKIYITLAILGALAPFLGGAIATSFGVWFVFAIVIALLSIAMLVLFKTGDRNYLKGKLNLKKIKLSEIKNDLLAYAGSGLEASTSLNIWPIFLFLIVESYVGIGLITSIALIITVAVTFWVSKKADTGKRKKFVKMGGILAGVVNMIRIFVSTTLQAFGVNIAKSLASSLHATPFISEYYLHADEESRSEYIFMMESVIDLARTIFFFTLALASLFASEQVVLIFGLFLGGIGAFLTSLMPPAKCEICGPIENKNIKVMPQPHKRGLSV